MNHNAFPWFKTAMAVAAGVAALLLVDNVFMYRYVTDRFVRYEGLQQAVAEIHSLESQLRRENVRTVETLRRVLSAVLQDRNEEIAWMSVITASGQVQASVGTVEPHVLPSADRIRTVMERSESYSALRNTSRGRILIALLPIRTHFQSQSPPGVPSGGSVVEVGLYLQPVESIVNPLGRNLLISTLAAFLLLTSIIVSLLRMPGYVRGRMLENQVHLARSVQRRLLPKTAAGGIEFAGECLPADEVGGDFFDVFRTNAGETVLVLADISGKGLPAAIRMGVVHGAIRALSLAKEDSGIACMAERLNDQLRDENSREFVTLFWAFYNPKRHDLLYVNAGHLPPLLVASMSGEPRRLETGGPVLGLLPRARYQEECINLDGDATLIAYSDGLLEATSPAGEEFGESRLLPVVRGSMRQSAQEVLRHVMEEADRFMEGGRAHDDLTVLIAKLTREPTTPSQPAP